MVFERSNALQNCSIVPVNTLCLGFYREIGYDGHIYRL
jgi:hypothetical protein